MGQRWKRYFEICQRVGEQTVMSEQRRVSSHLLPHLIRLREASFYLGMDRNRFNREVRPYLTEIPIGTQGIAFERLELDAWVDHYKSCNGRPGQPRGDQLWDANARQGSASGAISGTSKSRSKDLDRFTKALERATFGRRNDT
jgi:hypothetical protein